VVAYEKVMLLGCDRPERLVDYARRRAHRPQIFIRSGLVEEQWNPGDTHAKHDFLQHNRAVLREAEDVADRTLRRGMLVDDQAIFDFYDARLPSEVTSGAVSTPGGATTRPSFLEFDLNLLTDADDRTRHAPTSPIAGLLPG
jgi:ATP-dependent helicase HrpA